jgi:hypothetical protein
MVDATTGLYRAALSAVHRDTALARFDNARVRDALGYRAWTVPAPGTQVPDGAAPAPVAGAAQPAQDWMTTLARRALAVRHTRVGRALYRLAPKPWLNALKSRLIT